MAPIIDKYQPLQENGDEDQDYVSVPKKKHLSLVSVVFIASLCLNGLMGVYIAFIFMDEGEKLSTFGGWILF